MVRYKNYGENDNHNFDVGGGQDNQLCLSYVFTYRQRVYLVFKRCCDFVIALIALIVLQIPFLIIAVIQKITMPKEPVFFKQTRIGKCMKPFTLVKFRSMKSSAPHDCATKDFSNGEQYITTFGRFLRNTSIDELPQLFQVLTGKMSLIGPRPLIPQEKVLHKKRAEAGIYSVCPGMTGLAQVNGRDFVNDTEKFKFDKIYVEKIGLKMDLKILWTTIKKVVTRADIQI